MSITRAVIGVLAAGVIIGAFVAQRYAFWILFREFCHWLRPYADAARKDGLHPSSLRPLLESPAIGVYLSGVGRGRS